jgi:hypothetical protein
MEHHPQPAPRARLHHIVAGPRGSRQHLKRNWLEKEPSHTQRRSQDDTDFVQGAVAAAPRAERIRQWLTGLLRHLPDDNAVLDDHPDLRGRADVGEWIVVDEDQICSLAGVDGAYAILEPEQRRRTRRR